MTSGIYSITNTKNKKRYIGSAVNIEKRWREHAVLLRLGRHHSRHLQSAWDKYGEDVFRFEMVATCDPEDLIAQEQFWIDAFQTANDRHGYNIAPQAGSVLGLRHSDETRARMSATHIGMKHSDETKAKMSVSLRQANARPEVKAKISAALSGIKRSIETRVKVATAVKEAMSRPEVREKISGANLGRKHSTETKAKMSAAQIKSQARPEVKAKLAAAMREVAARPEVKAKMSAARRGQKPSAETLEKRSVSLREAWARPEVKAKRVGSGSGHAKLNEDDVIKIRELLASNVPQTDIAQMYGVTFNCIYSIRIGRTWSHVK